MLYGPEYTGLIQVGGHFISPPSLNLFSFFRLKFGVMATGSLSTLMTGISDHRTGGFSGFSEGNCCKVASEKRRLLLRPLFRSKRVLGKVKISEEIKSVILNHLTRSTNLSNQVALIEKAYAKIHGSYEVNINHNNKLVKLKTMH